MKLLSRLLVKSGFMRLGLRSRFMLLFYVVVVLAVSGVGYYGYQSASAGYRSKALNLVAEATRDLSVDIEQLLRTVPADLEFVANYFSLSRYLYWQDLEVGLKANLWKTAAIDSFRSFMRSRGQYYKLRFLDLAGQEKIAVRYDRTTDTVSTEGERGLEDKGDRPYFQETMQLAAGALSIVGPDLNMSHGVIEKPQVPVIRFSRPVDGDNGVRYGVAVLTVYADAFLDLIRAQAKSAEGNYYLVSARGDYFFHPNPEMAWGHLLGRPANFADSFPEIFHHMESQEAGAFAADGQIVGFARIHPDPRDRGDYWHLIIFMPERLVLAQLDHFVKVFALLFVLTLVVVFVVGRGYVRSLLRPLTAVTRQLETLGRGETGKVEIHYGADDEIAVMLDATSRLVDNLEYLSRQADLIGAGNYSESVPVLSPGDRLGNAINNMTRILRENRERDTRQQWLLSGQSQLDDLLRGEHSLDELAAKVVTFVATYLAAPVGIFYLADAQAIFRPLARYACTKVAGVVDEFGPGEGLVGQAVREQRLIVLAEVPADYLRVSSGLGEKQPVNLLVVPFIFNDEVLAALELGSFTPFDARQLGFLEQIADRIGIAVNSLQSRVQLQEQREELWAANEELEEQTQQLQASEEELRAKQEQLEVTNEELEEKNQSLNQQKRAIEQANRELETARLEVERKAEELTVISKYKSEFMANMSHELRTPLNSLLLLARNLRDNKQGRLGDSDLEAVKVIHQSGQDLLALINDILDLSKIEAGRMELLKDEVGLAELLEGMRHTFRHLAAEKGLTLEFTVAPGVPRAISSDRKRLDQILKNLLANAIKFTHVGKISLTITPVGADVDLRRSGLVAERAVAIRVKDTGIGIAPDKQAIIFEAFQQVDGGTARKYGGTGLGLSISRELAGLLGGEIQVTSEPGRGSEFTLYLPMDLPAESQPAPVVAEPRPTPAPRPTVAEPAAEALLNAPHIPDDRDGLVPGDRVILLIEDDPNFAALLLRHCNEQGFKCLAAATGEAGLAMAAEYQPAAIILDIKLPGMDGWQVLEILKEQTNTRHIPVHVISAAEATIDALQRGAIGFLEKPATKDDLDQALLGLRQLLQKRLKELLVVAGERGQRQEIITLIGNSDVHAEQAASGAEALARLREKKHDCLIMGLDLPDMTGFELLRALEESAEIVLPPVIVYTGEELSRQEAEQLRQYAESIIIKGVKSEERLLDEASLFLHRVVGNLPDAKQRMIRNLHEDEAMFQGKRVLVVDDDMRNVFAISRVLRDKGMEVLRAEDGIKALELLDANPAVDLIMMDIMMPEMDGYETMRRIRARPGFSDLPIIALTAKAMAEDRKRCLAAGANDYLAKPVDATRLFSLLRVWLYR